MIRLYLYLIFSLITIAIVLPILIFKIGKHTGHVYTFKARPVNDTSYLTRYYQVKYRTISEIYKYLLDLVESYSFFCEFYKIGHTTVKGPFKGFPIHLLKISSGFPKPIIVIAGGVYANDWKTVTSVLYVANQLLTNCSKSKDLITRYDWHLIPCLNPDGYHYSQTTPAAMYWIKNMERLSMDHVGVNIDYNFSYQWKKKYNFNEDSFGGLEYFSEAESQTFRDYIHKVKHQIEMVIILKTQFHNKGSKENAITFPWSYTPIRQQPNWLLMEHLAIEGAKAAKKVTGKVFKVIQSGRQYPNQTGKIDDWLIGVANISRVITIQTEYVADLILDLYQDILKTGMEVFAIAETAVITAYNQPFSYRKTHPQIKLHEKIVVGDLVTPEKWVYDKK